MGRFFNSKVNAFQDVLNSKIYIDKTGLLEYTNSVIDTTSKFICNSRPRRFGKSITADMLTAYYSRSLDTEEIFEKLEVGKTADFRKHLNQYDVIHIDIQWCIEPAGGADQVITFINKNVIEELRETYEKELSEGTSSLPDALSQISAKTGKKFILILDEWDVLIRDEAANQKIQDEYINFLRGLFKGTETSVYKRYKQDKIEMRGDRAEMSDFPLYLNTVAGGLDRRDQTIGGFSFVVKIYTVPVVEIIG